MVRAIAAVGIDGRLLLILSLRQELFDRQPDTTAMPVVQHHKLTVDCLGGAIAPNIDKAAEHLPEVALAA
ncbi:MAG: hypothetical protein HC899_27955 [Leptolyngbyaceae cyanobacterium SM1_4_3]|nr:hypothetical protein [Leptolyngbyaceae cyanobacterium SM1_4_3]